MNLIASVVVAIVLSQQEPGASRCKTNDVIQQWRADFENDESFAGLALSGDGRSATLRYTGDRTNFDRLVPHARRRLKDVVQTIYASGQAESVSMFGATIFPEQVTYSLAQLAAAETSACEAYVAQSSRPANVRIDIKRNRVVIEGLIDGISDLSIYELLPYRGVEAQLDLRAYRRPVTAGTQIGFAGTGGSLCTLGFIIKNGATYRNLTASHCTPHQYFKPTVAPPELRQNGITIFDGIGTETVDPGSNCTGSNPSLPCRLTDAAIASMAQGQSYTYGQVAIPTLLSWVVNPACRTGTCSETTWGATYWLVPGSTPLTGESVEHIGRTSGRVVGNYLVKAITPMLVGSGPSGPFFVGAHNDVEAAGGWANGDEISTAGDSGGPVVKWSPTTSLVPLGILFSGAAGTAAFGGIPAQPPLWFYSDIADIASDLGAFSVY